jgi:hypothetical protein
MELSFFYWVWLRESKFRDVVKEILGKNIAFRMRDEIIVNPNKNADYSNYILLMKKFLNRTSEMREKYLLFHYDNEELKKKVVELVKEEWGSIKIVDFNIENQRKIGPRGSKKYILMYS